MCTVQTADQNWFLLLALRLYSELGFPLYENTDLGRATAHQLYCFAIEVGFGANARGGPAQLTPCPPPGPCFLSSLISLLVNVALVGGAAQRSRKILGIWLAWHSVLLLLFWTWSVAYFIMHDDHYQTLQLTIICYETKESVRKTN